MIRNIEYMKKILFYIHSLNKGGAERVLLTLAEKMNTDSDTEVVILTDTVDDLEYELPDGLKRINIKDRIEKNTALARICAIRACVKEEKPDKFVAFMLSSAIRAVIATLFSGHKVIAAVRSNPYDDYSKGLNRKILLMTMSLAEKIACQTEYQVRFFPERLQKKCVVISNPIFSEFVIKAEELSATRSEKLEKKRIVATGRLFDYKNHKLLIEAFSGLAKEYPDIDVVIYGEGPYRKELENTVSELNLSDRVFLPGDSEHVAEDIADAFIYVLPSDTEGLPNALMEAMALGLPVISTDCPCGGPKSLIKDGENGLLTPVGDVSAMREGLRRLISDDSLRKNISQKARDILISNDADLITDQWKKILSI